MCHRLSLIERGLYGKATFYERMAREIAHVKQLYPEAMYVGIADGAKDNWAFLKQHTTTQVLDFYHAAGYLADAALCAFPERATDCAQRLEERCHDLKHKQGAASRILKELEGLRAKPLSESIREKLESAITYFRNHKHQMYYARYHAQHLPIGSGVTEAACKTLVKQRLCCSRMKWREKGASLVLTVRALVLTKDRWKQFWSKINHYGFPPGRVIRTSNKDHTRLQKSSTSQNSSTKLIAGGLLVEIFSTELFPYFRSRRYPLLIQKK
jgi:hypothetical protein